MTDMISPPVGTAEGPVPPQSQDAERSVLAAMLLDHETIGLALELLEPASFYRLSHQKIFEAIIALYNRNERADLITVSEELRKRGDLEAVGGTSAISQILEYATTSANLEEHAKIVSAKSLLRSLIKSAGEIQQEAFAGQDETNAILDRAEQRIFSITDRRVRQGLVPLKELLKPAFEHIQTLYERKAHVTGVPSGYDDIDKLTAGFQPSDLIIIAGRPAMGKCVTGDALIDDPVTGERRTLEEFVRLRSAKTFGVSSTGLVRSTAVADWIDNGIKPCFRVTTQTGREIQVTANHPFLSIEGWRPLSDLAVGEQVAIPRAVPAFGRETSWSVERARLLAYFIAEGGLTTTSPHFTNADPAIVSDFQQCVEREFPSCETRETGNYGYRVIRKRPWKLPLPGEIVNPVKAWLTDLGLMGKLSRSKTFPSIVWTLPRAHLSEFLRALFSCDGTIYPIHDSPRIEFTVASEGLANDVQHALTRFGIVAKLWRKTEDSWRVEITEPESIDTYQSTVGWIGEKTTRFADHAYQTSMSQRRANRGFPGVQAWSIVQAAADEQCLTMIALAEAAGEPVRRGFNPHRQRGITRGRLERYAHVLDDPRLDILASLDLYWDRIIRIEPIGERQVYDLTVPDGSNFIANDIVLHNSSFAVNIAENAAIRYGVPSAIFSLEMSKEQLVLRLLCSQSEVPLHKVRNGFLGHEDWPRLTTGAGLLTQAPIMIDDSASLTVFEIRAKCRRLKAEGKLGLVVIDYLQLIRPAGKAENRVQEISQITRALKALSKELSVPIIALSQLSRAVEQRHGSDKRPQLSDLRESGSVEQDSDVVMFVFREEYYKPDDPTLRGKATIIIAKQRNGPTASVDLTFLREFTKFVPFSPMMAGETEPDF